MMNAAAPSAGGQMMAPMPAAERIAPPMAGAYPARFSIGHATDPSVTVLATPLPETVPSSSPATVTARPGPAPPPDLPDGGHRPLEEELPGARGGENGPVDGEQDDVGGRHLERHAEDALERHVGGADDARDVVAAVRHHPEPDQLEQRPVERVDEKAARR